MAPWAQGVPQCWLHPFLFHPGFRSESGKTIHCTWTMLPESGWTVLPTHLRSVTSPWVLGLLFLLWDPGKTKKQISILCFLSIHFAHSLSIFGSCHLSIHSRMDFLPDNKSKRRGANFPSKVRRTIPQRTMRPEVLSHPAWSKWTIDPES